MYPTLVLTDGREHPYARQGDLNKCHLNSNGEPGGGGTCHRKAATPSSMAMLSGPAVIVSRAAARTTAVIVIGPAAAVVDTNFFCHRPTPRRVGRNGTAVVNGRRRHIFVYTSHRIIIHNLTQTSICGGGDREAMEGGMVRTIWKN
jgi:hypothetical protein